MVHYSMHFYLSTLKMKVLPNFNPKVANEHKL